MNGSPLLHAMKNAAVEKLDDRGLMPLDDARALVRAHDAFRKGATTFVHECAVLESDRLWAALLSLESVDEFVREASRLDWYFHPRNKDNVDPIVRFGDGILPWLETFIHRDGVLVDIPWCVVPCLNAIGGAELFEKLWSVRVVFDLGDLSGPGPFAADSPGDFDRLGVSLPAIPEEPDHTANGLVIGWIWSQPESRFPLLAQKSAAADPRARLMLKSLAQAAPSEVFGDVASALGSDEAARIFLDSGAPMSLDEGAILTTLDAAAGEPGCWPVFFEDGPTCAYLGMRVVAFRQREGERLDHRARTGRRLGP